ncbi:MAG: ribosomal protein L7/L12, partial [Acidimicrobiales bacterium]|nr:ribosomal protein L7/L12 [Acidimicrobiales bacterium]
MDNNIEGRYTFTVYLVEAECAKKPRLVKEICRLTGQSLSEARDLVSSVKNPGGVTRIILSGVTREEAMAAEDSLSATGAWINVIREWNWPPGIKPFDTRLEAAGGDFAGAVLSGVNLKEANLKGADFSGADLSGANLERANLEEANLEEANLE